MVFFTRKMLNSSTMLFHTVIALSCLMSGLHACYRQPRECDSWEFGLRGEANDLSEPSEPGVFHDLTKLEMQAVRAYLESTINIAKPDAASIKDPHIYTMMLEMPNKTDVLDHIDHGGRQPDRMARVVTFRGDLNPAVVQELICGPLPNIDECIPDVTVPFAHRPIEYREYDYYHQVLMPEIDEKVGHILLESYGGSFDYENCEEDCLNYWITPVGNALYGLNNVRKMWIYAMYSRDYYSLYPVNFAVLANIDGTDISRFSIEKVVYENQMFDSLDELATAYNANNVTKIKISYPSEKNEFSSLKPNGPLKPDWPQRPPQMVEPDGRRYVIKNRHIKYMDMWSLDYRISPLYGPGIWDVRFQGERIAYEISLMELMVVYSGSQDYIKTLFYADSHVLTGSRSKSLVKGSDCPSTATMLKTTVTSQSKEEPVTFLNSACVFEQNLGKPLRRHHSYSIDEGAFYGGMADSALVIRSIHAVDNYDYVIDFTFHQNGAIGVSVSATGYILATFYTTRDTPYGHRLNEHIYGPIHIHAAHFKVDLDINGTSNRYETLDIKEEETDIESTNPTKKVSQIRFDPNLKQTEKEAAYKYNFNTPKYHIFHKDQARNGQGEKKSYRIVNKAMADMLVKNGVGNEPSFSWTKYQMAVTKRKDSERISSAPYNQWAPVSPAVNFQGWIDDNEDIVDKDLVAWVTLGIQHIPHTEDLPVTSTAGKEASFYLHPYNYFPSCPSMKSRDSVYMEHLDQDDPEKGLTAVYPGDGREGGQGGSCIFVPKDITESYFENPDEIFETTENNGVL